MKQKIKQIFSAKNIQVPKWFIVVGIILAIFGFADASYLSYEHLTQGEVSCPIDGTGCDKVLTSEYSEMFGIPTALYGSVYYLAVFVLFVLLKFKKQGKYLVFLAKVTGVGFLFSLYMVYLQLFVLHAICPYCMGSAVTSTLLFLVSVGVLFGKNKKNKTLILEDDGKEGDNFA